MSKPTGPACGNNPNFRMSDGDRQAVAEFRAYLADRAALRDRVAAVLRSLVVIGDTPPRQLVPVIDGSNPRMARIAAWQPLDVLVNAVLAVLPPPADRAAVLRTLEQHHRPNTPPSRPEPRLPDHIVNEEEAPSLVKQRADCTELEWAEQERARFERLYTRETTRADLAEQRADTAARDADIYQKRLERLSEGYTEQRNRAEEAEARAAAMERAMESTAADALAHRGCHRDLMGQCLRAERAEAEAQRLRTDRAAVLLEAAQRLYTALFPAVYDDMGQKAAEGVNRAVSELRRMADEAQQQETDADVVEAHRLALSFALGLGTSAPWDAIRERAAELHGAEAQQQPDTEARHTCHDQKSAPGHDWECQWCSTLPDDIRPAAGARQDGAQT
ncbi:MULTISPECIES: hypothetical protein [unclassified Streptomyces]|uniref:hypothetical protein n=1 Tax=unclassified Streptomyces TaxID=2593676 RepID=UPI0014877E88|nr:MULTISPECIES: hypothetical protein [unclassified Streptomyces]